MRSATSSKYYYAHNHLYSPVALMDFTAGTVLERYDYDAYGATHIMDASYNARTASAVGNPYTFTSRELDTFDSGNLKTMHYRHRSYDPFMGRFGQQDPLGTNPAMLWRKIAQGKETYWDRKLSVFIPEIQYLQGLNRLSYAVSNPGRLSDSFGMVSRIEPPYKDSPDLDIGHFPYENPPDLDIGHFPKDKPCKTNPCGSPADINRDYETCTDNTRNRKNSCTQVWGIICSAMGGAAGSAFGASGCVFLMNKTCTAEETEGINLCRSKRDWCNSGGKGPEPKGSWWPYNTGGLWPEPPSPPRDIWIDPGFIIQ